MYPSSANLRTAVTDETGGDVANTSDPVPVSSLIAVRRFALDGEFGAEAIMMGEIAAEIKVKNTTATSAMWQAG
jgi:hypothetical protein